MLRLIFHLLMTSITGGWWLVVLLIDFLIKDNTRKKQVLL